MHVAPTLVRITTAPDTLILDNGAVLAHGDVFSIKGEYGKFEMRGINPDGSISCWGGRTGHEKWRAIRPDRVTRIHRPKAQRG